MSELKPCPFCGSEDIKISPPCNDAPEGDLSLDCWDVTCRYCGCSSPFAATEDEMFERWNKRIVDEARSFTLKEKLK